MNNNLEEQIELLKWEKQEDYRQYQAKILHASLQERQQEGVTWYPVRLLRDYISTGERITLDLEKTRNHQQKHAFQVGAIVAVFTGSGDKGSSVPGVVSYIKDSMMRVVLNGNTVPDWVFSEKIGINLLFDDGVYREMHRALKEVISARNNRLSELRDILYGKNEARTQAGFDYEIPGLNTRQNEAFSKILHARDLALVHGPPGTGKTTTLVKCIREVVKSEKQVLVCAPSNAAVDVLVERLAAEQLNVVRLGHPARLTPEVIENSMDVRISKHPDFSRLKEMRRQSEQYREMAKKYKRNYGQREKMQRNMLFSEARSLKAQSRNLETYITDHLIDQAQVVACTLTGANHQLIRDRHFKTVFIDEASQALEAACWIPLNRAQKVVMSGDHHQLPPTIKSADAARGGLEKTLFAKGTECQPDATTMLEVQYRMAPAIMGFSSRFFYKNALQAADVIAHRDPMYGQSVLFIDTAGAGYDEQVKKETLSTYNEQEARFLIDFMRQDLKKDVSVGVIAPYKAQIELLTDSLNQSAGLAPFRENLSINTVDAFQGQERDVIYISLVRSNANGEIGFLKEYRRMNVALTRARLRLVVVGDSATLGQDTFYGQFIQYVQDQGRYASVYEYLNTYR